MTRPEPTAQGDALGGPAYYAQPSFLRRRALRDWWTVLHPPYTAWHLAYVVVGACLIGPVDVTRLVATLLAFFLAVGIGAHAFDELRGRPLATSIPSRVLACAGALGIAGAVAIGIAGVARVGPQLVAFIAVGVVLALGYNLELFGGRLHTDLVFVLGWGAFPVLTAYFAQHARLSVAAGLAALFACGLSRAQRQLSTPARSLRRRTLHLEGTVTGLDGTRSELSAADVLSPLEGALRSISWSVVALACALAAARLHPWSW